MKKYNNLNFVLLAICVLFLSGCQISYLIKNAYHQTDILLSRQPIEKVLQSDQVDEKVKRKIKLASEAKTFAEKELELKATKNYTSYVSLARPYVTYVVSASNKWELKAYMWSFPIVGSVPYKGFFSIEEAKDEALYLEKENNLDTFVRGVSAYSTLGWFDDPILSSMIDNPDEDLVNTIIHESVHSTIFIKDQADFNERLATFIGDLGTEAFYLKKEGIHSETVKKIKQDSKDQSMFSKFISNEIMHLKKYYNTISLSENKNEQIRENYFKNLSLRFKEEILPNLKGNKFKKFHTATINNARLIALKTYFHDLDDFRKVYEKLNKNLKQLLDFCNQIAKTPNPEQSLKDFVTK